MPRPRREATPTDRREVPIRGGLQLGRVFGALALISLLGWPAARVTAQELPLSVSPTGRVYIDAAAYREDAQELSNGSEFRLVRMGLRGAYGELWGFKVEADFAGSQVELKDAYIEYEGFEGLGIRVGNAKEPLSLEWLSSNRHLTFMERALPNALVADRHLGAQVDASRGDWLVQAGIFGQEPGDRGDPGVGSEGWAASGRLSFAPTVGGAHQLHLGASASRRSPDSAEGGAQEVSFSARPEGAVDRTRFLDTGDLGDVRHTAFLGLEAASVFGPWSIQGEYMRSTVSRSRGSADAVFHGSYLYLSWFPLGGGRGYRTSGHRFDAITPREEGGTLELAVRFSTLDLNGDDGAIGGGSADQFTLGANWYFTPFVRLMGNVVFVDNDSFADGDGAYMGDDDLTAFQLRFQISF